MNDNEVLGMLEETGALLNGHFQLRSGLHSDRFIQCAMVLQYPHHAERLCAAAVDKLRSLPVGQEQVDAVISPALGGLTMGHEVGRALGVRAIFAEKVEGKLEMRRFKIRPGERYVVAEDVVTRGGRVQETIDIVKNAGGVPVAVVVLADRSGGTVDFGIPLISLIQVTPETWPPEECPLCRQGSNAVHPGS